MQGGVVMGMGYALTESIPIKDGLLLSGRLKACGLPRATDVPKIEAIAVEVPNPEGPGGAKGLGEIPATPPPPPELLGPASARQREANPSPGAVGPLSGAAIDFAAVDWAAEELRAGLGI